MASPADAPRQQRKRGATSYPLRRSSRRKVIQREEKKGEGRPPGYECEFVEPPPKVLQSECSICLLVLREPHMVSCCGHSFCETCIGSIQRDGKPCPLCNEPGFSTMANKGLKRTLNEFRVRCPHRELGCEWVDELGMLDQHLNADPQPERQLEGCQFTSVECIHCKDHMTRHVIAGHQNERCPKRPYTCEYCEEYESTFEDVVDHWAECEGHLVPCPNNCDLLESGIKRQNLEHHVKEECPLTVVECDFHYAGCGVKRLRKDMAGHMKENSVAHISLLAAENQRLAKQLLERDEKMQQLSNRIDQQDRSHQEQLTQLTITQEQQQHSHLQLASKVAHQMQGVQERKGLRQRSLIVPIDDKMAGFKLLKDVSCTWCSPPFYTHMFGYKMCLKVYANGFDGTHVSVFTCLMGGEFDSHLKWPFRGDITIQLLNQLEDREHHTKTIPYSAKTPDDTASRNTLSIGWGIRHFIPHSQLNINHAKNCQYLKDDCLVFRVLSVNVQQ